MSRLVTLRGHLHTSQYLPPAYVRTTGGYVFTGVCLFNFREGVPHPRSRYGVPHLRSGGYPISGLGGTPSQVWLGGTPSQVGGVPHLRSGGYPIQVWLGGTLSQVWGRGVPHLRSGRYPISGWGVPGVPPNQVWMMGGYPGYPPHLRWGTPYIDLAQGTPT